MTLTTHHLQFTAHAHTAVELDAQSGASIRGALTTALWERFCTNKAAPTCAACPLVRVCPVAALVAPLREDGAPGGEQRPRPYVIRPPRDGLRRYAPGETITFGLGLFGSAAQLFPYVVLAAQELAREGIGRKLPELNYRRGHVEVEQIAAVQPLTNEQQILYQLDHPVVQLPGLPVIAADVTAYAATLPTDRLTLHFLTPLRLIDEQQRVTRIALRPFIQRLMRRLDELSRAYGDGPFTINFWDLLDQAERVAVVDDQTRWIDVVSYSSRQRRRTPIGGLVGSVTFEGDLTTLRELLVWGSLVHVGKNAVKGDGWYRIATA